MLFERPETGTRALILHIDTGLAPMVTRAEFSELADSAGLEPVVEMVARRRSPDPRTFVGSGKLEDVAFVAHETGAGVVLVDQDLSPAQERNIEDFLGIAVRGRTGLILDIFAARARTHEGKLQVELARLQHESARLVRGWTHLDRQRGGSGRAQGGGGAAGLGGAGETQLEADQRILGARLKQVHKRLDKVRQSREINRRGRAKAGVKTVSLVGYTNAGKSTVFNRMCDASVVARDQLFATLDPTLRRVELAGVGNVIMTDTVGFIRKLPHTLIDAFRATLEEVCEADLLLHVVDASTVDSADYITDVLEVLHDIGADEVPRLTVYNKIDLSQDEPRIDLDSAGLPTRVWVSAVTGAGMQGLAEALTARLAGSLVQRVVSVGPRDGKLRAALYSMGTVDREDYDENGGARMVVTADQSALTQLLTRFGAVAATVRQH